MQLLSYAVPSEVVLHLAYSKDGHYLVATLGNKKGIRVFDVASGYTALTSDHAYGAESYWADFDAMNRLVEPIEVAQAIAWLLSPASSGVTGINLPVDAGFIAGSTWDAYGGLREAPSS